MEAPYNAFIYTGGNHGNRAVDFRDFGYSSRGGRMLLDADTKESVVVSEVKQVLIFCALMKASEDLPGPPSRVQRINTGGFKKGPHFIRSANKGTLDFEGYDKRGRFLGIECKRPKGGRLSPEQKARIDDINAHGGVAFVTTSGQEALQLLTERGCV